MIKYFINKDGKYLGAWVSGKGGEFSSKMPEDAIEVAFPPEDGRQIWNFEEETWMNFSDEDEEKVKRMEAAIGDKSIIKLLLQSIKSLRDDQSLPEEINDILEAV